MSDEDGMDDWAAAMAEQAESEEAEQDEDESDNDESQEEDMDTTMQQQG